VHEPELNLSEYLKGDEFFVNNRLYLTEDDAFHLLEILREIQQNRSQVRPTRLPRWQFFKWVFVPTEKN
jgi:hypothetical protein